MVQIEVTGSSVRKVLTRVVLFTVLIAVALLAALVIRSIVTDPVEGALGDDRYQAVTLTNGNLYFGHLESRGGGFYELTDAFYIREEAATDKEDAPSQKVERLSTQFLQGENRIVLNGGEIVSVQDLKKDSPVAEAIDRVNK